MKKKNIIILGIIFAFCIAILIVILNNKETNGSSSSVQQEYTLVTNYSTFFTVSNCVNKYLGYLKTEDTTNLLLLLNNNYQTKNNINNTNLFTKIDKLPNKNYKFIANKMYQKNNDYYVHGYFVEETLDTTDYKEDYSIIITMNNDQSLFSVTPYNGDLFKEQA